MSKQEIEKSVNTFDDSLQRSLTHTRPDPQTQAPQVRPAPVTNGQGGNGSSGGSAPKKP